MVYDPTVGRFLSKDPLGLVVDPNPYRYVHNSPTNFTDPTGLAELSQKVKYGEFKFSSSLQKGQTILVWQNAKGVNSQQQLPGGMADGYIDKGVWDDTNPQKPMFFHKVGLDVSIKFTRAADAPKECYYWSQVFTKKTVVIDVDNLRKLAEVIDHPWGPDKSAVHGVYPSQHWSKDGSELLFDDHPGAIFDLGYNQALEMKDGRQQYHLTANKTPQQAMNGLLVGDITEDQKEGRQQIVMMDFQTFLVDKKTGKPEGFITLGSQMGL